jgi:hypothetical protein
MLKKFLIAAIATIATLSSTQTPQLHADIIRWNTFGNSGTETSEPSSFTDPNIAAANLTLGAGVTAAGNGNRFGGSGWFDTGNTVTGNTLAEAIAGNSFIQFVVTPTGGATFSATSLDFIWDRTATTGPSNVALRSSFDSFATDLGSVSGITAGAFATNSISIAGLNNVSAVTTFRLYGFGATAPTGTGGFDASVTGNNVVLQGTVTAVPEPSSIALVSLMGCAGLVAAYCRRKAKSVVA